MAKIDVNLNVLSQVAETTESLATQLGKHSNSISQIKSNLNIDSASASRIKSAISSSVKSIESEQKKLNQMAKSLETIRQIYQNTENSLSGKSSNSGTSSGGGSSSGGSSDDDSGDTIVLGILIFGVIAAYKWYKDQDETDDSIDTQVTRIEIDSIVYDDEGGYGGDQGAPKNVDKDSDKWDDMYEIAQNYYPDMTEKEFTAFLKRLNNEGCGYVALVNTIFVYYEGRADEFEEAFGFPMYGDDGDLNYELLLVDLYACMDNTDGNGNRDEYYDYSGFWKDGFKWWYDYEDDETGVGTTPEQREVYLENYMEDHGVTVNVTPRQELTADDVYDTLSEGDQIIVRARGPMNIYNMDGTVYYSLSEGSGHAMTVTGVTEDGMLIVSSWGEQYCIDPNSMGNNSSFEIVEYE